MAGGGKPADAAKQTVHVTILSRPYTLRAAGDAHDVEALAAEVNELMLNIASKAPHADSTHIAVLACLHLADKLREAEEWKRRVGRETERYAGLLDGLFTPAEEA